MNVGVRMTVGVVARMAGVTVRTLHHYDALGLVSPAGRSDGGYRLYESEDVDRLQEVLFFRELGLSLDEIGKIVGHPTYVRADALVRQRELLAHRSERLIGMIDAIDRALEAESKGMQMTPEEKLEVFGDFEPAEHEEEARRRWGDSEAYRESQRRTNSYTKADWEALGEEAAHINARLVALMDSGVGSDDRRAMDLAEEHRLHIGRWFYDCSPEIHLGLADMYVGDPRFTESIDRAGEGLAAYLADAIRANAASR